MIQMQRKESFAKRSLPIWPASNHLQLYHQVQLVRQFRELRLSRRAQVAAFTSPFARARLRGMLSFLSWLSPSVNLESESMSILSRGRERFAAILTDRPELLCTAH